MKQLFLICMAVCLFSRLSIADWEAKFNIDAKAKHPMAVGQGKAQFKKKKMRFDIKGPLEVSFIGDANLGKGWALLHSMKMLIDANLSPSDFKHIPLCDESSSDSCLIKAGFKKLGSELVNTYDSTLYELSLKPPQVTSPTRVKAWKVNAMKEMVLTRVLVFEADKPTPISSVDLTEIKPVQVLDSIFLIPKDYRSMPNVNELFLKATKKSQTPK